jgi:hypothetical protein
MTGLTTKQFGDACEHHVIACFGFARIPAIKLPDNWPGADVMAQPLGAPPQRISVKGRRQNGKATHVDFDDGAWDWLAVVIREEGATRTWILPRSVAMIGPVRSRAGGGSTSPRWRNTARRSPRILGSARLRYATASSMEMSLPLREKLSRNRSRPRMPK